MHSFTPEQKEFLTHISHDQREDDWIRIPGYVKLAETKTSGKITGLAGVTMRYYIIPSLFIAVSPAHRGKGLASQLMQQLLKKWHGPLFLTFYRKKIFLEKFYGGFGFKKIMNWSSTRVLCVKL